MDESEASGKRNPIVKFFASPLDGVYPAPMRELADWSSLAGIVLFIIAVFALPWLTIGVKNLLGISKALGLSKSFGLFVSPWAWLMVAALVAMVAGLWFVQTRGAMLLAANFGLAVTGIPQPLTNKLVPRGPPPWFESLGT